MPQIEDTGESTAFVPQINWGLDHYQEAQAFVADGKVPEDERIAIQSMIEMFQKDVAGGWVPPAKTAQRAGVAATAGMPLTGEGGSMSLRAAGGEDEFEPHVPKLGALMKRPPRPPPPTQAEREPETDEELQALLSKPKLFQHDPELNSASKLKVLYSPPIYEPEPDQVDPRTGQVFTAEQMPASPYYHLDPSAEQVINYIDRASAATESGWLKDRWTLASADIKEHGRDSTFWQEFADRQWQEVYKTFQWYRVPVMRVEHSLTEPGNLGERLKGEMARAGEPFVGGMDLSVTFGAGREALATYISNKRYDMRTQEALGHLEESGTLMPMGARMRDAMDENPLMVAAGVVTGVAGAGFGLALKGAQALTTAAKYVTGKMPALFRGTQFAATAPGAGRAASAAAAAVTSSARGKLASAVTTAAIGGTTAATEEAIITGVAEAGQYLRDEEEFINVTGIPWYLAAPMGAGGAVVGRGVEKLIGRHAENLRSLAPPAERKTIASYEDYTGKRGTGIFGLKETPKMREMVTRGTGYSRKELAAQAKKMGEDFKFTPFKVGEEAATLQLATKTVVSQRDASARRYIARTKKVREFYGKTMDTKEHMHNTADALLEILRDRKGVPVADATVWREYTHDSLIIKSASSTGQAEEIVRAHGGGTILPLKEAKDLFNRETLNKLLGKARTQNPTSPLGTARPFAGGFDPETGLGIGSFLPDKISDTLDWVGKAANNPPVYVVAIGRKLNPKDFDTMSAAVENFARHGEDATYKSESYRRFAKAIYKDRERFGKKWADMKQAHSIELASEEGRKKIFGVKDTWNINNPDELRNVYKALKGAGRIDDASDSEIWTLLAEAKGLTNELSLIKAVEARRQMISGATGVDPGQSGGGASVRRSLLRGLRHGYDAVSQGAVGDPLRKIGPGGVGFATPRAALELGEDGVELWERIVNLMPFTSPEDEEE